MQLPTLPPMPTADPVGDYARAQSWAVLNANRENAANMSLWAVDVMNAINTTIEAAIADSGVSVDTALSDLLTVLNSFTPAAYTYTDPTAPTYLTAPGYTAPTMGALTTTLPTIHEITVPSVPSVAVDYTNSAFTDSLLTSLKARLEADIAGVTAAETAMFARHEGRVSAERAKAYTEITTQFSSGGWDMPPGALLAKRTEMNNETSKRLTDVSADIMMTAVKESLQSALQTVELISRLHDSDQMRDFEKAKAEVQMAIEGFKATVDGLIGQAQVDKTSVDATIALNDGVIKTYLGEIEAQIAPIKATADTNQSLASGYRAAVDAATANLTAQTLPDEMKLKALSLQSDVASKAAVLAVEAAGKELALKVETMRGSIQGALQVIASAQNTMSTSTSFGWSAGSSTGYDGDITTHSADKRYAVDKGVNPA